MRKLYRTALVAGVLAFGVAACGDDVQIVEPEPTPPPALQVTLTPANATATVGENASFAVGISGGEASAEASWTCASANPGVASVSSTATGCQATALSAGNTQISVTVTKGDQSSNAGANLEVTAVADDPATVSIDRITQGGTTNPVDISNVQGQIDVTLNLDEGDETPTQVDVLVDGEVAASQVFTSAMLAEMAEEAEAAGQEVQSITLSFNTGAYDVDEEAFTATAHHENGERVIGAQVHVEEREAPRNASNTITVEFNNDNTFHVLADRTGIDTEMDPNGLLWYGGPDFEITVYPIPVMYDGEVIVEMTARLDNDGGSVCPNQTDDEAPFGFTFECSGVEAMGHLPVVQSTVTESGENGPTTGFGAALNIANVDDSDDHPFPMRIDVQSPNADGAIMIIRQSGLDNVGNWVNDEYNFMQEDAYTRPTDDGVGGVTEELIIRDLDNDGAAVAAGDLMESVTSERYRLRVIAEDALGNARTINQSGSTFHPDNTFGYDVTDPAPVLEDDEDLVGQLTDPEVIINLFAAGDAVSARVTDNLSGFADPMLDLAVEHALIWVRGAFQDPSAPEVDVLTVGGFDLGDDPVTMPFAALAAGDLVADLVGVEATVGDTDYVNQTAFMFDIELGTELAGSPARYYIYQFQFRDQAGNTARGSRSVYLNNNSVPRVQNLSNPSMFDAMTTFEASIARDSVELLEGSLEIRYPSSGGSLVWERPTADISSMLRMDAGLLDGELFNDVIYRPQNDVMFPLGWDVMGLPFLKNIQTMADGDTDAKPDSVRARVFNGYGADQDALNHSAMPYTGGSGFSALIRNAIIDEEVADASVVFNELHGGNWTFEIVEDSAVDCDADYCVRAVGPLSTFTNPFDGGPVFVVWADRDTDTGLGTGVAGELQWRVLAEAEPNFSHPFPTRDSGNNRIYEWEFSLSGANTGDLEGDLAFGALGMNANTGDGLLAAEFMDPPEPVFNVVFEESSYDVEIGGAAVQMDVVHGTNSTGEGFTIDACVFIDENGNTLVTNPTGLTLTANATGCEVDADGTAEPDSWTVQAQVTGDDSGAATAETTVVVGLPAFEIAIDGPFTVEVPAAGDPAVTQVFSVTVTSGDPISAMNCSLSPTAQGVSVVTVGTTCEVTVNDAASAGTFDVIAMATEDGTGRTDTAIGVLNVTEVELALDPVSTEADPTELSWTEATTIDVVVSGSRDNTDIDTVVCAPSEGWITFTQVGDGCELEIDASDPAAAPGDYTVEYTVTFLGDGRTDVITGHVTVPEAPEFAPVYDIETTADDRRDIERDRTANFIVESGEGVGIDVVASAATIEVSPQNAIITADDVIADLVVLSGEVVLQVTVPGTANTGNYTVTITMIEQGTGAEVEKTSYIRVIDTGTIEIDDGAL